MTNEELEQVIYWSQKVLDGEKVQYKHRLDKNWTNYTCNVTWSAGDRHSEWRIAPEPIEAWAVVDGEGELVTTFASKGYAHSFCNDTNWKVQRLIIDPEWEDK